MHYSRWYRYGDTSYVKPPGGAKPKAAHHNWSGGDIRYRGAHKRVKSEHGPATDWPCAMECGSQAAEWAYCHDSPSELTQPWKTPIGTAIEISYSPDPYDYVPLCKSCHRQFDRLVKS